MPKRIVTCSEQPVGVVTFDPSLPLYLFIGHVPIIPQGSEHAFWRRAVPKETK